MYLILEGFWLGAFLVSFLLKGETKPLLFITYFESFVYVLMAVPVFFGGIVVIKDLFNAFYGLIELLKK
jgi:hypothetical protein